MNRVIKYRAWIKDRKRSPNVPDLFQEGYKPRMVHPVCVYSENGFDYREELCYLNVNRKEYDFELMQFTGLLDSEGVEIYEGDIVEDKEGRIYLVKFGMYDREFREFSMRGNGWHIERLQETEKDYPGLVKGENLEVIGNRFEDPELLGGCFC